MDSMSFRFAVSCIIGSLALAGVSSVFAAANPAVTTLDRDRSSDLLSQAVALEHGEGVEKDERKAFEIYCRMARMGDAEAQFSLGWMFANGRGVPRDDDVAALLIARAAEGGHEHATKVQQYFSNRAMADLPECMKPPVADVSEPVESDLPQTIEPIGFAAPKRIVELVQKLAPEYRVHPNLALAVIQSESNFDPNARSPKNAQGLMQLIPETAERFNVRKPFDPEQNIRGGLAYLRWLLAYFQGKVALVAAGYNAGEGAVVRYRGIPPYPETRSYVQRILALYQNDVHPFDPNVTSPPAGMLGNGAFR